MSTIREYIAYRYQNWLDYASHMARVHNFEGWQEDLLNDIICDLLSKPQDKLDTMLSAKTKKIVNGTPTTELDKFVLSMLKMNACSAVAPFRKNTLGQKIVSRAGKKIIACHHVQLNGYDAIEEEYSTSKNDKLERMHKINIQRLQKNGFNEKAVEIYKRHFVGSEKEASFTDSEKDALTRIRQFLIVTRKTLLDDN